MYVLQELWRGNITPSERYVRSGSEYRKISQEVCDKMDAFLENLTPEARKQLEAITDLKNDMSVMVSEDSFLYGFRLGARMILDIVGDYKGQFYSPGEPG